ARQYFIVCSACLSYRIGLGLSNEKDRKSRAIEQGNRRAGEQERGERAEVSVSVCQLGDLTPYPLSREERGDPLGERWPSGEMPPVLLFFCSPVQPRTLTAMSGTLVMRVRRGGARARRRVMSAARSTVQAETA